MVPGEMKDEKTAIYHSLEYKVFRLKVDQLFDILVSFLHYTG